MNTSTMKIAGLAPGELEQYRRNQFPLIESLSEKDKQKLRSERTTLIITGALTVLIVGFLSVVDPSEFNLSTESQRYLILCILTAAAVAGVPLTSRYIRLRRDSQEGIKHVGIATVSRKYVHVNDESSDDYYVELKWKSNQAGGECFELRNEKMYELLETGNSVYIEIRAVSKTLISFVRLGGKQV